MPETKELLFKYPEIVEALLKQSDIHEGLWTLAVQFGLGATNAGPSAEDLKPSAIVSVLALGISRADKPTNLTVDASVVNPAPASKPTTRRKASPKS
jgi:hypothetical protein